MSSGALAATRAIGDGRFEGRSARKVGHKKVRSLLGVVGVRRLVDCCSGAPATESAWPRVKKGGGGGVKGEGVNL